MAEQKRRQWLAWWWRKTWTVRLTFAAIFLLLVALARGAPAHPRGALGPLAGALLLGGVFGLVYLVALYSYVMEFSFAHGARRWFLSPPQRAAVVLLIPAAWPCFYVSSTYGLYHHRLLWGTSLALILALGAGYFLTWPLPLAGAKQECRSGSPSSSHDGLSSEPHWPARLMPAASVTFFLSLAAAVACLIGQLILGATGLLAAQVLAVSGNAAAVAVLLHAGTPRPLPTDRSTLVVLDLAYGSLLLLAGALLLIPAAFFYLSANPGFLQPGVPAYVPVGALLFTLGLVIRLGRRR